jgi:DNA polymerase/3'-5' exonuclease PolX
MPNMPDSISCNDAIHIYNTIKKYIPLPTYLVGSVRRESPIVNDIDIIVITNKTESPINYIKNILYKINRQGERIVSGLYAYKSKSVLIDFFICNKQELPYSMIQYTGPKSYNIRIRRYVKKQYNWLLNQYGIFYADRPHIRVNGSANLKTEKNVINFIGITYYNPIDRR